mgnify:CR=1 FL=1
MAEYIDTGDTVEGQKCEIYTRREDCKGLREDPITQKKMLVYELDRNSSVEVRESLILSEEEKILRDELNIHGYVDVKRQLSVEKQEGLTSTHGGRLISTKKRTVGRIKYPFQNLNKLLGLSANSNNRKQLNK